MLHFERSFLVCAECEQDGRPTSVGLLPQSNRNYAKLLRGGALLCVRTVSFNLMDSAQLGGQCVVSTRFGPVAEHLIRMPHIQVERWIETSNPVVSYRLGAGQRLLVPVKRVLRAPPGAGPRNARPRTPRNHPWMLPKPAYRGCGHLQSCLRIQPACLRRRVLLPDCRGSCVTDDCLSWLISLVRNQVAVSGPMVGFSRVAKHSGAASAATQRWEELDRYFPILL